MSYTSNIRIKPKETKSGINPQEAQAKRATRQANLRQAERDAALLSHRTRRTTQTISDNIDDNTLESLLTPGEESVGIKEAVDGLNNNNDIFSVKKSLEKLILLLTSRNSAANLNQLMIFDPIPKLNTIIQLPITSHASLVAQQHQKQKELFDKKQQQQHQQQQLNQFSTGVGMQNNSNIIPTTYTYDPTMLIDADLDINDELRVLAVNVIALFPNIDQQYAQTLSTTPILPNLSQLLTHINQNVIVAVLSAIDSLSHFSTHSRDVFLKHNVMEQVLGLSTRVKGLDALRAVSACISSLIRGKPAADWNKVSQSMLVLYNLLNFNDEAVVSDATWAISYLADRDRDDPRGFRATFVMKSGVVPRLIQLLDTNTNYSTKTAALRCIGALLNGPDKVTEELIQQGVVKPLLSLLSDTRPTTRREVTYCFSNLATVPKKLSYNVFVGMGILDGLYQLSRSSSLLSSSSSRTSSSSSLSSPRSSSSSSDIALKVEIAWTISNLTYRRCDGTIRYIFQIGFGQIFICDWLKSNDVQLMKLTLDLLTWTLEHGIIYHDRDENGEMVNPYVKALLNVGAEKVLNDIIHQHSSQILIQKAEVLLIDYFQTQPLSKDMYSLLTSQQQQQQNHFDNVSGVVTFDLDGHDNDNDDGGDGMGQFSL